ncbi:hypothetical protein BDN72DRAFT_841177 [Pluteus cervinus]|uniref:Uncharacterized protein n=1 Tax=Pluteus cervinus TaxID=181527 RepID=A0ACD3AUL8_9AGAR|nr:hypothetical protein BDN72DRAFT_841177 [Pluteus cervinus]
MVSRPTKKEKEIIGAAKKGSLRELAILAKSWYTLPEALRNEILLIFFHHLNSSDVPTEPNPDFIDIEATEIESEERPLTNATRRAFWSLSAIARCAGFLQYLLPTDPYGADFIQAWPGIFKWSVFLYASFVQSYVTDRGALSERRAAARRITRETIARSWCALSLSESAKKTMLETRGVVGIAAELWIFEDTLDDIQATSFAGGLPYRTVLSQLQSLWRSGEEDAMKHIISVTRGDLVEVAKTLLRRLKKAFNSPEFVSNHTDTTTILTFLERFCDHPDPEVCKTFLENGAIAVCVRLLTRVASILNARGADLNVISDSGHMSVMIIGFRFLGSVLETTSGAPWVLQAIKSGLLSVFVECSPAYGYLTDEAMVIVFTPLGNIIPRYLVYSGVVQAMDAAFFNLENTARVRSLRQSRAWRTFEELALWTAWRFKVIEQIKKASDTSSICSNRKCHKVDVRNNFRKCGNCGARLYCSKECQVIDWKEFGHKQGCTKALRARIVPREDGGLSRYDYGYMQNLNIYESLANLPTLIELAATKYAGVPLDDLMIVINYNTIPFAIDVLIYREWAKINPELYNPPQDEHQPHLYADGHSLVIGFAPCGKRQTMVVTHIPGGIWFVDEKLDRLLGAGAPADLTALVRWKRIEAETRRKEYSYYR